MNEWGLRALALVGASDHEGWAGDRADRVDADEGADQEEEDVELREVHRHTLQPQDLGFEA